MCNCIDLLFYSVFRHPKSPGSSGSLPQISIGSRTPASGQKSPANADRHDQTVYLRESGSYLLLIAEFRFTARLLTLSSTHVKLTNRICNLSNRICNHVIALIGCRKGGRAVYQEVLLSDARGCGWIYTNRNKIL